jgi:hypothetical protein
MLTFGMGGSGAKSSSCTAIDIKWVLKKKKIKFNTKCQTKK